MARVTEIVAAARAGIGSRFRAHGREPRFGMDCVGVAAFAFGRQVAGDYPLRGGTAERIAARIMGLGLARVARAEAGDLLLVNGGAGQWHLAIATGEGFVHACARLGRVVETPGLPGPVAAVFRETD